jgi:hypothetical protein
MLVLFVQHVALKLRKNLRRPKLQKAGSGRMAESRSRAYGQVVPKSSRRYSEAVGPCPGLPYLKYGDVKFVFDRVLEFLII